MKKWIGTLFPGTVINMENRALNMEMVGGCHNTEAPWTMVELKKAIAPFPRGYVGIVTIVSDGTDWRSAETLPKTKENKSTSDFPPSAVVGLFFKTFAYLVLGRIKATLDAGSQKNNMLLTTNLVLEV